MDIRHPYFLTKRDFIALFPSASILTERVAGLV